MRENVRAVTLDVVVTDGQGRPVEGLSRNDFHVTEDNVPQRIQSFESPYTSKALKEAPRPTEDAPASVGPAPSDQASEGQPPATILLLDEVSTGQEDLAYGRAQLLHYLRSQPGHLPQPMQLLVLTGKQLHVTTGLTQDREQLIRGLKSDPGITSWYALRDRAPGFQSTGLMTAGERLRTYLETTREIAAANVGRPGHKNLVWIGPGLLALSGEATSLETRSIAGDAVRRASAMMLQARMTLYTVDPQGLLVTPTQTFAPHGGQSSISAVATAQDPTEGELTFERLALLTGGRIYRMRNDVGAEIGESVRDGADTYTLSYTPADRDFNGKYRRIRVTVDRPGLTARTRDGYSALPDTTPSEQQVEMDLELALTSALHYSAIPVSARQVSGSSPAELEVAAGKGALRFQAGADGQREAQVEIVTGLLAESGKVVDSYRTVHQVSQASGATANWTVPLAATRPLGKERIRAVRVLVRDRSTGAIGSYDLPLALGDKSMTMLQ